MACRAAAANEEKSDLREKGQERWITLVERGKGDADRGKRTIRDVEPYAKELARQGQGRDRRR